MRLIDKLGWLVALLGAAFLADGSQTERGGDPDPADTATEIVVPAHDAQPLPVVEPPAEDLSSDVAPSVVTPPGADADPPSAPVSEVVSCHRINVGVNGGTAVCVAPGVFVTVRHVFENAGQLSVSIDGVPVSARWHLSSGEDVAVVLATVGAFEPCEWADEAPEYMAAATVIGMVSGIHTGVLSDYDTVSLSADSEGITQGDSGGGVFVDGKLVGVLRGYRGGVGENRRVVKFTPLHQVPDLVAVLSPASEAAEQPDDSEGYAVTTRDGVSYWNDATGRGWHDQGTGLNEGWTYGGRFTYRNGRMHDVDNAPQASQPAASGYWKTVCRGNYCERVWVPYQ